MELREEHRLVGVIERKAKAALGSDIPQLLIVGLVPVESVHILIHIDFRIAAFPCTEVLQPRPIVFRQKFAFLAQYLTQFLGTLGFGRHIRQQLLADMGRYVEIVGQRTAFYILYQFLGVLVHSTHQFENCGRVGG